MTNLAISLKFREINLKYKVSFPVAPAKHGAWWPLCWEGTPLEPPLTPISYGRPGSVPLPRHFSHLCYKNMLSASALLTPRITKLLLCWVSAAFLRANQQLLLCLLVLLLMLLLFFSWKNLWPEIQMEQGWARVWPAEPRGVTCAQMNVSWRGGRWVALVEQAIWLPRVALDQRQHFSWNSHLSHLGMKWCHSGIVLHFSDN